MSYVKYFIAVVVLFLSVHFSVFGQEMKQEAKPEGTTQAVTSETTPTPVGKQEATEEKHKQMTVKEKRLVATVGTDGIQRVEIMGGAYYFDPNYIIVKVNVPVELTVKKAAGEELPHDIMVKAPDAGIDFKVDMKNEARTITFTPTKTGKYEMYCDKKLLFFKSHKDRGMDGWIEVVQ